MTQEDPVLINEDSKVNWSIVLRSPHAVAYRLWTKQLDEDWVVIAEGRMADDKVDAGEFEAVRGTEFGYWLGIGSDKPQSQYNISIILSQESRVLEDGVMEEKDRVDDSGIATVLETVTFK